MAVDRFGWRLARRAGALCALAGALLGAPPASADPALAGLSRVGLGLAEYAVDLEGSGLDRDALLARLAARLEQGGVNLAAGDEWARLKGRPVLRLHLRVGSTSEEGLYGYLIRLALSEDAAPLRDPARPLRAETWSASALGSAGRYRLDAVVPEDLNGLADAFARAWRESR